MLPFVEDPCYFDPCLNGATCKRIDDRNRICYCAHGFIGVDCQFGNYITTHLFWIARLTIAEFKVNVIMSFKCHPPHMNVML